MGMMDKMLSIIGKGNHIKKSELVLLKKEFGDEVGDKIYEIAGKGSRLSKAELVEVGRLFESMAKPIKEEAKVKDEIVKDITSKIDMIQNEKLSWLITQVGQIRTSELGYMGEEIHMVRGSIKSLEKDIQLMVSRLSKLELSVNKIK